MKIKYFIIALTTITSSYAFAAPDDLFLQASDFKKNDHPLTLQLAVDAVNDTIDILDMRQSEGISGDRGDYLGAHLSAQYQIHPNWQIEGRYYYRDIDFAPDTNTIHTGLIGLRYQPDFQFLDKNDAIAFRGSIWGNQSDTLKKSTPTRVQGRTLDQVEVEQPQDFQLQFDALFSRKIDHMNQINAFASLGYSQVELERLNLRTRYQGCLANISIDQNNQYTGHLIESCQIGGAIVDDLNLSGDAAEYGLDMQKDLNYDSYFASVGGSWNWRYQQFESQLAYQYQRLWRDNIDDRLNQFGHHALKDNHNLGLKLSYDLTPRLTAFVQGEIYQHNFVGQIPFLYNGVTASRLDRRYGLASIGVKLHSF